MTEQTCRLCGGEGRLDTDDGWTTVCHGCHGQGVVPREPDPRSPER